MIEQQSVVRGHVLERDQVYRLQAGRWSLALELTQALSVDGGESGARVRPVDLLGDGHELLVFVFPEPAGAGGASDRAVDVVDGKGLVVVHRELYFGGVRRAPEGGLETWSLVPGPGAKVFRHEVDRAVSGPWLAEVSDLVPGSAVPGAGERF